MNIRWNRSGIGVKLLATAGVISALTLASCSVPGDAQGSGGDDGEQTFISGLYLEPKALDPHRQVFWETYRVSRNVFEPLVGEDLTTTEGTPELVPVLATHWEPSDEGRTWTFRLREGVTFHDGSPFNAEALEKNVRRITDPTYEFYDEQSAGIAEVWFGDLAGHEVVDEHTFVFEFSRPLPGFPRSLAQSMYSLPIGNPAVWEQRGNDGFADHAEGTGPYTLASRTIGDRIELDRNENYWGEEPVSDSLVFRIIPNNQTRVASLLNDEVDMISYVRPDDVETLEDAGYQVPEGTGAELVYFSFNLNNPLFEDQRVREALTYGINRPALATEVYNGYATPQYTFFPPGNEAHREEVTDREFDREQARTLLREAGYAENDLSFNLIIDKANEDAGQWLQAQLKEIGVTVEVISLDRSSYSDRLYNPREGDGLYIDEFGETGAEWLHNGFNGLVNRGLDPADHPEVVDAIDTAFHTPSEDDRIRLWQEAEEKLREKALVIPAINLTRYYALGPDVEGFVFASTNWYDLAPVSRGAEE